jgi:DNA-binding response OmpR family regulator
MEMPVLDGMGLYRNILKEHSYLKDRVLFITGSVSEDKLSTLELMNQRYLIKPFKLSHLLDTAGEILKGRPKTTPD